MANLTLASQTSAIPGKHHGTLARSPRFSIRRRTVQRFRHDGHPGGSCQFTASCAIREVYTPLKRLEAPTTHNDGSRP